VVLSARGTPDAGDGKRMVPCPIHAGGNELGLKYVVLWTCIVFGLRTISADDDLEVDMDCTVWNWKGLRNATGSHDHLRASEWIAERRACSDGDVDRVISSLVPGLCRDVWLASWDRNLAPGNEGWVGDG